MRWRHLRQRFDGRENHNDLRRTNRPSVIELQRHGDLDFLRDRLLTPRRSILALPRRAKVMVCHQTGVRPKIAILSMVRNTVVEWIVKSKSGMETQVSVYTSWGRFVAIN